MPITRNNYPTQLAQFEFSALNNPILFVNDAPERLGGLSRIGRDIASLVATMPEFRVGYLGRGGCGRVDYPWMQYSFPDSAQWGEDYLPSVWEDFSRGKPGIIMSLWDASRMLWFANPKGTNKVLERFLGDGRNFLKWGYFPVDSRGPNGFSYGTEIAASLQGYDRVLAASEWGAEVLYQTSTNTPSWIPHGYWNDKFFRRSQVMIPYKPTLGCVMANQSRKHWPVAFECAAILKRSIGNKFIFWAHTDQTIGYWNLYALAADYELTENIVVTNTMSEYELSAHYSACDVTILPSGGEGFGYPIVESMACGTACVVTDYAAGQEIVDPDCRVKPKAQHVDTQFNLMRPVNDGFDFAKTAHYQIRLKQADPAGRSAELISRVSHLEWPKLSPVWRKWFLAGLAAQGIR